MDYPREVYEHSMFFPNLPDRAEAEQKIRQGFRGKGTYLLRPSSSTDYSYISLSISETQFRIHHVKINIEYQATALPKYYVASTIKFSSLTQLLDFYSRYEIHVQENIKDLKLLCPLINQASEVTKKDFPNNEGGKPDFNPSDTGQNPTPDYLELENTPNAYLQPELSACPSFNPPIVNIISPEKKYVKPLSSKSTKEKKKNGIKDRIVSKFRSKTMIQPSTVPMVQPEGKLTRSNSQCDPSDVPVSLQDKRYHCRPPAPLPPQDVPVSDEIIYTYVSHNHDFFEETYKFLKENELCECGLRLQDSELPDGWAVHLSKDEPTVDFIFFQRDNETTWDIPEEILPSLSNDQISFILSLCHKKPCPIPPTLTQFITSTFLKNKDEMSNPVPASPVRKSSLPSFSSTLSLPSSQNDGSKLSECRPLQSSTGTRTADDENGRFEEAVELPLCEDDTANGVLKEDNGYYERADDLFQTNSAEGSDSDDTVAISLETGPVLVVGKPLPAVRTSVLRQGVHPDSNHYVVEDLEVDAKADLYQQDQKRSRASSLTSSTKSSSSLSDSARPLSKQVTFEVPSKGIVLNENVWMEDVKRKSDALAYSFKTLSVSGDISSQDAVLPPGPVEIIAVASPSTQLTQQQLMQLQQQSQVPVDLAPSQRPQIPGATSHLYQLNDAQHINLNATPQLIPQMASQQQYQPRPMHLQQIRPALQPMQIIDGQKLQYLPAQRQMFFKLQDQQLVKGGDQMSPNSGQVVFQESLPFRRHGQNRQSLPEHSHHPLQTQQRPPSLDNGQMFYVVRNKPN